jgi:hypothetical protein
MDARLSGVAKSYELSYTRYADDITFSGKYIPVKFLNIIDEIVQEEGFRINEKKTQLSRSRGRRIVTGLSVASDKVRIPRGYKRKLRQEVHYILKYGDSSHENGIANGDGRYLRSVLGKLNFWSSVERNNPYLNNAIRSVTNLLNSS